MNAETIKTYLEISVLFLGAIGAFLVWLMSAVPKVRITALFWFPTTAPGDTPFPVSAQLHFYNPAVGSVVVTEIEVNRLIIEQKGREICRLSPYAFLSPLVLSEKQPTFAARTRAFASEFLIDGHAEITKHIGFHFDRHQTLALEAGELMLKLEILFTSYDPVRKLGGLLLRRKELPLCKRFVFAKDLSPEDAATIASQNTVLFLPRGLPGVGDLQYRTMEECPTAWQVYKSDGT